MPKILGQASPNFSWAELSSHDSTGDVMVPPQYRENALAVCRELERIRRVCGNRELWVTCCYRTPGHNAEVGGAQASQHLYANAADILPPGKLTVDELFEIVKMLAREPESRIRYAKRYAGWVHLDLRRRDTPLFEVAA